MNFLLHFKRCFLTWKCLPFTLKKINELIFIIYLITKKFIHRQYIKGLVISVPKCENISLHIQLRVKWVRASFFKNCIYFFWNCYYIISLFCKYISKSNWFWRSLITRYFRGNIRTKYRVSLMDLVDSIGNIMKS